MLELLVHESFHPNCHSVQIHIVQLDQREDEERLIWISVQSNLWYCLYAVIFEEILVYVELHLGKLDTLRQQEGAKLFILLLRQLWLRVLHWHCISCSEKGCLLCTLLTALVIKVDKKVFELFSCHCESASIELKYFLAALTNCQKENQENHFHLF